MKRTAFPLSYFLLIISYSLFSSCKTTAQISRQANKLLITDTAISKGFIGMSVFDPSTNTYLYNYNAEKYFVPASNVKLFTLYAGMKYLGDSLVGLRQDTVSRWGTLLPTGDPTFLHPDFKNQPVLDFLKTKKSIFFNTGYVDKIFKTKMLGYGWAWDDYSEDFMVERSAMPVHGNIITVRLLNDTLDISPVKYKQSLLPDIYLLNKKKFYLQRSYTENKLRLRESSDIFVKQNIPLVTSIYKSLDILNSRLYDYQYDQELKEDSLKQIETNKIGLDYLSKILPKKNPDSVKIITSATIVGEDSLVLSQYKKIYSQPSDSLFKPMMHRSDNFFAEQTLLMASNEHLGYMSDENIIDTLLKTDLKDVPHKPKWVDGSGLSRYNLFTPQDFIYILNKMKNEFGMERMKTILATGGEGTLKNYFKKDAGFIYAKTGTLSNNCALSGYIITKKNRLLIFSILANNYQTGATPIRKATEQFVEYLRDVY